MPLVPQFFRSTPASCPFLLSSWFAAPARLAGLSYMLALVVTAIPLT